MEHVCVSSGIRDSLPQQELVDRLLFPHALHNQPVQVDKQSTTKTTGNPTHRQSHGLLGLLKVKHKSILGDKTTSHPNNESFCCRNTSLLCQSLFWGCPMGNQPVFIYFTSSLEICFQGVTWNQTNQFWHVMIWIQLIYLYQRIKVNFMPTSLTTNQPSDSSLRGQRAAERELRRQTDLGSV